MLKTWLTASTLALLCGFSPAKAMPAVDFGDDGAAIVKIADGCTPYGHRDGDGRCRPGGQWGDGRVRPGPMGGCPPRYHLGPAGQWCWPNL